MKRISRVARLLGWLPALAAVAPAQGELANLSARLRLPAGGAPVIAGAVLAGAGTQTLLVRAVGPGLAPFGVGGTLADPKMTVFDAAGRVLAANDNWDADPVAGTVTRDLAAAAGAFALAAGSRDAATVVRAGAGAVTIHVAGADNGGGVVLIELYAVGTGAVPRLANLAVRADAGTAGDPLTAGFVVRGSVMPLLIRGAGPALAALGVTGPAADPRLTVFNQAGGTVAANDDWDPALVRQTTAEAGAFAFPGGSKDAATVVALAAGAYTVQIASATVAGGMALVEVYAVNTESPEINGSLRGQPGNIQDNVFQSLCIDPRNPDTVYLGTETNGIFKTTNGGATWTRSRQGLRIDNNKAGYPQIYEIAVDPTDSRTLYAATVAAPGPATGSGIEVLRSGFAGVYKSTDGGLSWQHRINGFINTYTPHVVVSKLDPRVLYAGIGGVKSFDVFYDGGMLVSRDGAENWEPVATPEGTPKNTPVSMLATVKNGIETLYVSHMVHGTDQPVAHGLFATNDGGRTWTARNPDGLVVQYFDVFAQDNAILYANDDSVKRIHKSTDGGRSWTRTALGNFGPIKIAPDNANTVIYTGFTTLMKSSDGLSTMRIVLDDTAYLNGRQFMDIKFSPSDSRIVWAAAKGYVLYKSTDGGEHFTRVTAVRDLIYGAGN